MHIALPEFNGQRFLKALVAMHTAAVAIRDQTGDLTYRLINDIQRADADMRVGIAGLQADIAAGARAAGVQTYLNDRGVAGNLSEIVTKVNALNTALGNWRTAVGQVVFALGGRDLIELRQTDVSGQTLQELAQKNAIPAASAPSLRASTELAAVITALEALEA